MPQTNSSRLRISLVIPAYNEEDHLQACLEAACNQTEPFYEIIVVDNNSTDTTAAIAREFPSVRLVSEKKQGVVHARDTGFRAATGDVIGRIDADTCLSSDWAAQLQTILSDPTVDAVSGAVHYYDSGLSKVIDAIDLRIRHWLARRMRDVFVQGVNMGLRRSTWQAIDGQLCREGRLHEDLDLAAHLSKIHRHVVFDDRLKAGISGRRIDTGFWDFWLYAYHNQHTYAIHHIKARRYMYPIIALILICYVPLRVLYRGFDETEQRFRWRRVFATKRVSRINPALSATDY